MSLVPSVIILRRRFVKLKLGFVEFVSFGINGQN
jgi:hypothetical protein